MSFLRRIGRGGRGRRALPGGLPWAPRQDDVGVRIVDQVGYSFTLDEEWTVRTERGFAWWGRDLVQRVWVEPAFDDDGFEIFRLHVQTDLLRDFDASNANLGRLNSFAWFPTTSGYLVDAESGTVRLAASMYAHQETEAWVTHVLKGVTAVQVADAHSNATILAEATGAAIASSAHPTSGHRRDPDEMLNASDDAIAPVGDGPSFWAGTEIESALDLVRQGQYTILATGSDTGFAAEFPFRATTSLLIVDTGSRSAQVGSGALLILRVGEEMSESDGVPLAFELTRQELRAFTNAHLLGSWYWADNTVQHAVFVPNAFLLGTGSLSNYVLSMMSRAKWAAETFFGDDWDRNRDDQGRLLAKPALLHRLEELDPALLERVEALDSTSPDEAEAAAVAADVASVPAEAAAGERETEATTLQPLLPSQRGRRPLDSIGESGLTTLLAWGIINPSGPTLSALVIDGNAEPAEALPVLLLVLNPFAQDVVQVGVARIGRAWNLRAEIPRLFPAAVAGSCPTVLLTNSLLTNEEATALYAEFLTSFDGGFSVLERVRRFPGDPGNRVTDELDSIVDKLQRPRPRSARRGEAADRAGGTQLAANLLDESNQLEELNAFLFAWHGSIEFLRAVELEHGGTTADDALSFEEFVDFFSLLANTCKLPEAFGVAAGGVARAAGGAAASAAARAAFGRQDVEQNEASAGGDAGGGDSGSLGEGSSSEDLRDRARAGANVLESHAAELLDIEELREYTAELPSIAAGMREVATELGAISEGSIEIADDDLSAHLDELAERLSAVYDALVEPDPAVLRDALRTLSAGTWKGPVASRGLREAVEEWLPTDGGVQILVQGSPDAPVVSISRNPGAGPRVTPTFFIGLADEERLLEIAQHLYAVTDELAKFMQTVSVTRQTGFLVVPAMYHLDDAEAFSTEMCAALESLDSEIDWFEETCEVMISHDGRSYRAVRQPNGSVKAERSDDH